MPVYTIHLEARHRMTRDGLTLRFERPPGFTFLPGQYIRFHGAGVMRDYTLISPPEAAELEICVRHLPEGRFTAALIQAPKGQPFTMEGPLGYFRYQSDSTDAVCVATGTGIAPFVAFVRAGVRGFTLLHGASRLDALLFREELRAATGSYRACLSGPSDETADARSPWQFQGRVTELLRSMPSKPGHFYLCGSAAMIRDAVRIIDERFQGSPVFTERFY